MNEKFPIPKLDEKSWDKLQDYLDCLSKKLNEVDVKCHCKELTECDVLLGLIDMVLGRTLDFDEAMSMIRKDIKNDDYWVLSSDYTVLLSNPPKYHAIIKHYHSDKGLLMKDIKSCSKEFDKIFTDKESAIKCSKGMNFFDYEIVEVDLDKVTKVVIGDDYE